MVISMSISWFAINRLYPQNVSKCLLAILVVNEKRNIDNNNNKAGFEIQIATLLANQRQNQDKTNNNNKNNFF